jgi:hypothetical protein
MPRLIPSALFPIGISHRLNITVPTQTKYRPNAVAGATLLMRIVAKHVLHVSLNLIEIIYYLMNTCHVFGRII